MKHLFIINPVAEHVKGKTNEIITRINSFFQSYRHLEYEIHVTRWSRDATGFCRKYVSEAREMVRVYACGGGGTLYEVLNGIIGLPNAQLAFYPLGDSNTFIRYFGDKNVHLFSSLRNLVYSETVLLDAMKCGENYCMNFSTIGMESIARSEGFEMSKKLNLPLDVSYYIATMVNLLAKKSYYKKYDITIDGKTINDKFVSILMANAPCYGKRLSPAVDAHPNDGYLDLYLSKIVSRYTFVRLMFKYAKGEYKKYSHVFLHRTFKKIGVSSKEPMCISLDGEVYYDNAFELEIVPFAVDFVCPSAIDISKIPRIFGEDSL